MSTINSLDSLSSLSATTATSGTSKALGQDDFLKLMTAQLKNQDPMKPLENGEFFNQIAQFSQVAGLENLNDQFGSLSSQMLSSQSLQASALVGHDVLVASNAAYVDADGITGSLDVPSSGPVRMEIRDAAGAVVRTMDLGDMSAGMNSFTWDGLQDDGSPAPEGAYQFSASVTGADATVAAQTYLRSRVDAVALNGGDLLLSLDSGAQVGFDSVQQIY